LFLQFRHTLPPPVLTFNQENLMLPILANLIGPDKLGGWVRSGVASLLAIVIAKWPGLSAVIDPSTQAAIGVVAAGIVVGAWQQLSKSDAGKVGMVDALAKDPTSAVKGVVVEPTQAGRDLVQANPGKTVAVAGSYDANVIASKPTGA
jgi:hypothetical protein